MVIVHWFCSEKRSHPISINWQKNLFYLIIFIAMAKLVLMAITGAWELTPRIFWKRTGQLIMAIAEVITMGKAREKLPTTKTVLYGIIAKEMELHIEPM